MIVCVPDLLDRATIAGNQDRAVSQDSLEHALFAIRKNIARAHDHGEGNDRAGEAILSPLAKQDVLAKELVPSIGILGIATFDGVRFGDREMVALRVDDG